MYSINNILTINDLKYGDILYTCSEYSNKYNYPNSGYKWVYVGNNLENHKENSATFIHHMQIGLGGATPGRPMAAWDGSDRICKGDECIRQQLLYNLYSTLSPILKTLLVPVSIYKEQVGLSRTDINNNNESTPGLIPLSSNHRSTLGGLAGEDKIYLPSLYELETFYDNLNNGQTKVKYMVADIDSYPHLRELVIGRHSLILTREHAGSTKGGYNTYHCVSYGTVGVQGNIYINNAVPCIDLDLNTRVIRRFNNEYKLTAPR